MASRTIVDTVRLYLSKLPGLGIPVASGVLYGSFARGEERAASDIDLLVVSPVFDGAKDRRLVDALWHMTWRVDSRIEPIPVGMREFEEDDESPLIGIARREGVVIMPQPPHRKRRAVVYPVHANRPAAVKESGSAFPVPRKHAPKHRNARKTRS